MYQLFGGNYVNGSLVSDVEGREFVGEYHFTVKNVSHVFHRFVPGATVS